MLISYRMFSGRVQRDEGGWEGVNERMKERKDEKQEEEELNTKYTHTKK